MKTTKMWTAMIAIATIALFVVGCGGGGGGATVADPNVGVATASVVLSVNYQNRGSITSSPSASNGVYLVGTSVTFTAVPSAGYQFSNWSGSVSGSVNPLTVAINNNKAIQANFATVSAALPSVARITPSASCGGSGYSLSFREAEISLANTTELRLGVILNTNSQSSVGSLEFSVSSPGFLTGIPDDSGNFAYSDFGSVAGNPANGMVAFSSTAFSGNKVLAELVYEINKNQITSGNLGITVNRMTSSTGQTLAVNCIGSAVVDVR